MKQLNIEVMHKQRLGRVQNPPVHVSHPQSSNTAPKNPADHPLRRSRNAKSFSFKSDEEDYH